MSRACRCHRQTCFQQLRPLLARLLEFLAIFWEFAKGVQDTFVGALLCVEQSSGALNTMFSHARCDERGPAGCGQS